MDAAWGSGFSGMFAILIIANYLYYSRARASIDLKNDKIADFRKKRTCRFFFAFLKPFFFVISKLRASLGVPLSSHGAVDVIGIKPLKISASWTKCFQIQVIHSVASLKYD